MSKTAFGFEQPEDSPGFLLWQTTMTWQRQIKRELDPFDISHAQFVIMALLLWSYENKQESPQAWIIQTSLLDKMTVSKSLKKLVSLEFVERIESEQDTRAKSVFLTTKGKNLVRKLVPIVENIDARFFESISKDNQKTLMSILKKLTHEAIHHE